MQVRLEEGTPTIVRCGEGDAAPVLRRIEERIRAAAHPGVVEVVASEGDDARWELHLAHAGRPLASLEAVRADQAGRIVAGVAETLADLHERGIVHGRIDSSHVLVGADGRPVLCGFGPDDGGCAPPDDVAALGALLVEVLGQEPDLEPIPDRRWRRQRGWTGWHRRSLLLLADQACAEPASRRPTARRLAASIVEALPEPSRRRPDPRISPVPFPQQPGGTSLGETPREHRPVALVGAALVLVVLVVGLITTRRPAETPGAASAVPAPSPLAEAAASHRSQISVDGNVVTVGDQRYEVGEPGDIVVTGDWDCDGTPTPALLRSSSGGVFVFQSWARAAPLRVASTRELPGAEALRVTSSGDGCDHLLVRLADGSEEPVVVEGAS